MHKGVKNLIEYLKAAATNNQALEELGYKRYRLDPEIVDIDSYERDVYICEGAGFVVKLQKHIDGIERNQTRHEWELFKKLRRSKLSAYLAEIYWHGKIHGQELIIMECLNPSMRKIKYSSSEAGTDFEDLLCVVLELHEVQTSVDRDGFKKAFDYGW